MKNHLIAVSKFAAVYFILLHSTYSFSQKRYTSYSIMEDTAGKWKPALIKKDMISYGFFSTLNQHISVEYDRLLSDNIMFSGQIGVITSGLNQTTNATPTTVGGGYGEVGVKLFFNPDYGKVGRHDYYVMQGLYLKPLLDISVFTTNNSTYIYSYYQYPPPTVTNQYSYFGAAIMLNLGGQWVIARCIVVDIYGGFGCSFANSTGSSEPTVYNYYGYLTAGPNFPLAIEGGINIGLPF